MCIISFIPINAQSKSEIYEQISYTMDDFISDLNNMKDEEDETGRKIQSIGFTFGSPNYFFYNGQNYNNLSNWLRRFYLGQLGDDVLMHEMTINKNSIKKESDDKVDKRYSFKATLKRDNESNPRKDFLIKDEEVTFVVMVEEDKGVTILEMKGNWGIKRITPYYEWEYTLTIEQDSKYISPEGEEVTFKVNSFAQKNKIYEGLKKVGTGNPIRVKVSINGDDKSMTDGGLYTYRIKRNISYDNIVHTFKVQQQGLGEEYGKGIRQGNGIQSVDVMFSQQGKSKPLPPTTFGEWLTDYDEYDAGDMDVKFHYGLKKTFGLSSSYRFEDSRFTLGLYLAMCKNRISQLDWNIFKYEQSQYVSVETGTTNLGTTVIVDKNGESITVEKYKETVSYIKPSKRGYSEQMDPDKEAEHKKVYSYVMVKPGIYINNWIQFDLGLGVARTQNTYRMEDAWQIKVIDKTYEKNGVGQQETENVYERTGESFLYKDYEKFQLAVRPGINFLIPLDKYGEHNLTLGAGYTYVPGDTDANNLDFSLGYSFCF